MRKLRERNGGIEPTADWSKILGVGGDRFVDLTGTLSPVTHQVSKMLQ